LIFINTSSTLMWPGQGKLIFTRLKHQVMEMLNKDGVDQIIGRDHIHNKAAEAVRWFIQKKKAGAKNDL